MLKAEPLTQSVSIQLMVSRMTISRTRRLRQAAAGLALLAFATGPAHAEKTLSDYLPDDIIPTLSGSYLAALSATRASDIDAATVFFEDALSQDPEDPVLLDRTFSMLLVGGQIEQSLPIAERLVLTSDANRMGQIVLGIQALKTKNYRESSTRLAKGDRGPLANVTASLLAAWAAQGQGETDAALKIVDTMNGPEWYGTFKNFNMALIAELAGRHDAALASISKAYATDSASMRIVEAYARMMARAGKKDEALKALDTFSKQSAGQPLIAKLSEDIRAGKTPAPLISTVQQGAAEVLYGIGSALSTEKGGDELGTVYLQLARYLDPKAELMTMALGDLLQNAQQFERSIAVFQQVPKSSPLRRAADMQIAVDLDGLGRTDDAIRQLKKLVATNPKDFEALTSLGTIYRGNKRFLESADMYSKAIDAIDPADPRGWLLYYYRGVAYEQAKEWDKAEADLLQSLKLSPNEAQVLNYLGYSWIDRSINLDRGMAMIKKAVDLKPDDGYIVDSLGWAYYRTGKYDEAVGQLERAIALKSDDSTINDHLGDAYWKVGRKLEATFQWAHARDMNPEPAAKAIILAKLAHGLDKVEESKVASMTGNTVTDASAAAPAPTVPGSITVGEGDSLWKIAERVYGNAEMYRKLIEANRGKFRNPNRIVPGTVLDVPPVAAP